MKAPLVLEDGVVVANKFRRSYTGPTTCLGSTAYTDSYFRLDSVIMQHVPSPHYMLQDVRVPIVKSRPLMYTE
jgi:hypothetical protein